MHRTIVWPALALVALLALAGPAWGAEPEPIRKLPGGISVDRAKGQVVARGQIIFREGPLEYMACSVGTKEHESVVVLEAKPYILHLALLALNVEPGSPVREAENDDIPKGQAFEVYVRWTDDKGKQHTAPANRFVRYVGKKQTLKENLWVFTGSRILNDPKTGRRVYLADQTGAMVSVYHDPTTMFDLPLAEAKSDQIFEANTEAIPPLNTKVDLILKVKPDKDVRKPAKDGKKPADAPKPEPDNR